MSFQNWLTVNSILPSIMSPIVIVPGGRGVVSITSPPVVLQTFSTTSGGIGFEHLVGAIEAVGDVVGK